MSDTAILRRTLRVLHLEDNENDYVLAKEMLAEGGLRCEFELAKGRVEFEAAIRRVKYDVIISDYTIPSYDGLTALSLARQWQQEVPFIFFSGTIGEDIAVESLKTGATDYVVKQRPQRLLAAVCRALREAEERARRKRVEDALRQSEERFRIVARATNDVIWEWDLTNNKAWFSDNFQIAFGHDQNKTEWSVESVMSLIHPDDRERVKSSMSESLASGGQVWWAEYRLRRADGSYAYVFNRAFITCDAAGKPLRLVGVAIDTTERRQAEIKIREQAELLNKTRDAIILCDMEPRVIFWNQGAERIYGWSAAEAVGERLPQLLFREDSPPQVQETIKSLEKSGEWFGELEEITKDNKTVMVQARATLIRDEQGQPKSLLIINTDITERKKLEEQFLRAQRLESLGVLVSGIAHDLNNTLTPVVMGIGFLRSLALPGEAMEILNTMEAGTKRGADMVKQILTFGRGGEDKKTNVQMDHLLGEMGKIIKDIFPKAIQCHVKTEPDCWPVSGVATQLHQVVMNLCINARDAMAKGGTLTLAAQNVVVDEAQAAQHAEAEPGRYLCLSVADTGEGISPELQAQIFQPFFTTKAPGKGTGLGLSTSLEIIRNHRGFIAVESEPRRGTRFSVYLPAAKTAVPEAVSTPTILPVGRGEHILVVDDEEAILALAKTTLENYGYSVLTAANGPEAMARFAEQKEVIQLIIADIAMPFMDGATMIQSLRKTRPDVKVIVASGFDHGKKSESDFMVKADAFLQKPFTIEKIITAVHEVLSHKN